MTAFEKKPGLAGSAFRYEERGYGIGSRPLDPLLGSAARAGFAVATLIVLFAILVGPVNLFVFCRGVRRHRMLWLTPLIALVFSSFIGAYVLVADGTGGDGYRRRLRFRPASEPWEFLVQHQTSRCGLLLGGSFAIPDDAILREVPAPVTGFVRHRSTSQFRIEDGKASGEWFLSRSVQVQSLEQWHSERGGVELAGAPDAPEVLSRVPGTLKRVYVRTPAGKLRFADDVKPGARVATREASAGDLSAWSSGVSRDMPDEMKPRFLGVLDRPGMWFAECSDLDAEAPETLGSIRWKNLPDVLVGDLPVNASEASR